MRTTPSFSAAFRGARILAIVLLAGLAVLAARADAAWREPVGGASPINHRPDRSAYEPSITAIDGMPYIAWSEWDDSDRNVEIRVSRLNAQATAWEEVVGGENPINHATDEHGTVPSLIGVGGVPYVAWEERVAAINRNDVRVSRLSAAGTEWEELGGRLNDSDAYATEPSITDVDGVPYVAWRQAPGDRSSTEVFVARLNGPATGWERVGGRVDDGSASVPSVAAIDGVPYVALAEDGEVVVKRLNAAGTAWERVGGATPISGNPADRPAQSPRLADIDGVPYVAWVEFDRGDGEYTLRVSRLNAAGTAWEELVGGENPINQAGHAAHEPSLIGIGGVPYVAWVDRVGGSDDLQVRVSRLNRSGTAWEEIVGGPSPINRASDQPARSTSLTAIGGVPYVAWPEAGVEHRDWIRASRLEPDFLAQAEIPTRRGAFLLSRVRTYGVAYPIAFEYGQGAALDQRTATTSTAYDRQEDVVLGAIHGLTPGTGYSWRTIGFDGFRPTGVAPTRTFTTLDVPPAAPEPPPVPEPLPPTVPDQLLIAGLSPRLTGMAGRKVVARYGLSHDAEVTLEVRRCGGRLVAKVDGGSAAAGLNRVTWNGRIRGRRPAPGCYTLKLRAVGSDGQTARDDVKLRLTRRAVRRR